MNGLEIKEIDALVRSTSKELGGTDLAKAYYGGVSFTRNYKMYYQRGLSELFEVSVSRDNFRKRTYILGITRIP